MWASGLDEVTAVPRLIAREKGHLPNGSCPERTLPRWRNWQTRNVEVVVGATPCWFNSSPGHFLPSSRSSCQRGLEVGQLWSPVCGSDHVQPAWLICRRVDAEAFLPGQTKPERTYPTRIRFPAKPATAFAGPLHRVASRAFTASVIQNQQAVKHAPRSTIIGRFAGNMCSPNATPQWTWWSASQQSRNGCCDRASTHGHTRRSKRTSQPSG
jgi:hypothetical protein